MSERFKQAVQEIINEIFAMNTGSYFQWSAKKFINEYFIDDTTEIDWIRFCDTAQKTTSYKFPVLFMCSALRHNITFGEYTELLQQNKKIIEEIFATSHAQCKRILCGSKLSNLIVCKGVNSKSKYSYIFIEGSNIFLINKIKECLTDPESRRFQLSSVILSHFILSFGEKEKSINSLNNIECNLIFEQVEYYKKLFKDDKYNTSNAISFLCYFYRWLVKRYSDYDFFRNSIKITQQLLFSQKLKKYLEEGYYFTSFNPTNIPFEHPKILFLAKGLDRISTRFLAEDHFLMDLSYISSQEYRKILLSYVMTAKSFVSAWHTYKTIGNALELLYETKKQKGYSNPDLFYFTTKEAFFIKEKYNQTFIQRTTKSYNLNHLKKFFCWCESSRYFSFEPLFFDCLYIACSKGNGNAQAIPDEELIVLNEYLYKKSKESLEEKLVYTIFHLVLQTEWRISRICSLKKDSIEPTIKPGRYTLKSNHKTTYGDMIECEIIEITYRTINEIIEATSQLREECPSLGLKDYIFLYKQRSPEKINVIDSVFVNAEIKKACKALGLKNYNVSNLRDTRMTKAIEHAIRNKKSNLEISLLTKHKQIDTTVNHYLDLELDKMLEASLGVEIGKIFVDTENKIVDEIPRELSDTDNDVENGCGKCSSKSCNGVAAISCLACKYFITTPYHKPFFEKEIDRIQQRVVNTDNMHEKEDLITIKALYALYLKAIYVRKENTNG